MPWTEVIVHCSTLKYNEDLKPKDLVDYFHFKYLDTLQIERWTVPNYKFDVPKARKLLSIYGKDFSFILIDLLFNEYNKLLNGGIEQIRSCGIGLLSADKYAWLSEKLIILHRKNVKEEKEFSIRKLLSKPRESWTTEEFEQYKKLIQNQGEKVNA